MIKIANAPCSWGALEFDVGGEAPGYVQVLDEMVETGYAGTELGDWGFMPTDPQVLASAIHSRGLTLVGAFVPVMLKDPASHAPGEEAAIRTARLLAAVEGEVPFIILADDNGKDPLRARHAGRITPDMSLKDAEWNIFAQGATRIAQAVQRETGLRTVFHHHCAGYVETPAEIDRLLSLTDPGLLGLCFDTGHYRFGGGDPLAGLLKYGNRIWHVHFKDFQPQVGRRSIEQGWDYLTSVSQGVFCELGRGNIDFAGLAKQLKNFHYDGWVVVEQDILPGLGKPKESASRNREYLRSIGL